MRLPFSWLVAIVPALASGQQVPWRSADHVAAIPRAELDAITARGRLLAEYDWAAWHATDAVLALRPREGSVQGYLARRQTDGRWEVVFGRQSADADTFLVAYRAMQRQPGDTVYTTTEQAPPQADGAYWARAARALQVCRDDFGRPQRPYNAMVVPIASEDGWFVYLVPAPARVGYWPLGADVRYGVSPDGRAIVERRRLHNAVLEFGPPGDGKVPEAGFHAAVLADRPEDTDVFHVLTRQPRVPEYIVTQSYYFRIDVNGRIVAFDRDTTVKR